MVINISRQYNHLLEKMMCKLIYALASRSLIYYCNVKAGFRFHFKLSCNFLGCSQYIFCIKKMI